MTFAHQDEIKPEEVETEIVEEFLENKVEDLETIQKVNCSKDQKVTRHRCSQKQISASLPCPKIKQSRQRNKNFVCDRCGMRYSYRARLVAHVAQHSVQDRKEEENKDLELKKLRKLEQKLQHDKDHKLWLKSLVPCPECGKELRRQWLSTHIRRVHMKLIRGICDHCGKGFFNKNKLAVHLATHISKEFRERNHKCHLCSRSFYSAANLKVHMETFHSEKDKIKKCECGKVFKNERYLQQHRRTHSQEKYSRICDQCEKTFSDGTELKRHIQIFHTEGGRKNFLCNQCGKKYDLVSQLNNHTKLVHLERKIVCNEPGCDKKFSTEYLLKAHTNIFHLKIKNFKCDMVNCNKAFSSNQRLRRHLEITHRKHRVNCPVEGCKYMVGRIDYMKNHLRKHTELKPEAQKKIAEIVKLLKFY